MIEWFKIIWLPLLLFVFTSCSRPTGPFMPNPPDPGPQGLPDILENLAESPPRSLKPVAAGITKAPSKLFVWDLEEGTLLWERPVTARSAPHVLGQLVVTEEEDRIVARSLDTGDEQFTYRDSELRLVGGDGEGERAVIGLSTGSHEESYSTLIFAHDGNISWRRSIGFAIGSPALRGQYVFVPWATQTLSVLDAHSGRQMVKMRMDDVLGHAFVTEDAVYMGQHGIYRLTQSFINGEKAQAAHYVPKARQLPGQPPLLRDAYEPPLGPDSAIHKVRMVWRPTGEDEEIQLTDNTLYFLFYRLVFAFDPDGDELRWVYQHTSDLIGASSQPGGILLADNAGAFLFVTAETGQRSWLTETEFQPISVRFRAGDITPIGEPHGEPLSLQEQLFESARMHDARLSGGRALAIEHLARIKAPEVTQQLISLCEDREAPQPVHQEACGQLSKRTTGSKHVIAALRKKGAYLDDQSVPPVGPLAQAAKNMKLRKAVPLLLGHLEDPHTPNDALAPLVESLKTLGSTSTARNIEEFLLLYHADPSSSALTRALEKSIEAVAHIRGKGALKTLRRIADDPMSVPAVRTRASEAVRELERPPSKSTAKRSSR